MSETEYQRAWRKRGELVAVDMGYSSLAAALEHLSELQRQAAKPPVVRGEKVRTR